MIRTFLIAALLLGACSNETRTSYLSPANTYQHYQRALHADDALTTWECFSASYRDQEYGGDFATWEAEWSKSRQHRLDDANRRQIVEEKELSSSLGYLLFDINTLSSDKESPFIYFLRDPEGWKMTSHLDSVFHRELEIAIQRGDFRLPTSVR
ncbi:MAG: hypothetical protein VX733_08635 [Candidatus Latescibacterota bacterium]|nr:hypothetical protein [Candidatus Latescibacterota bacterium]